MTGIAGNLSFALIGVGHLVGPALGAAMGLGLVMDWGRLVPLLFAQGVPGVDLESWTGAVFRRDVRFFGAGAMGIAAV